MGLAEHSPSEVYARNKAVLGMTKQQLSDFASTKEKNLPKKKKPLHGALDAIRNHGKD
jgi:hypothetical protein